MADEDDTDLKLAILSSLHPQLEQSILFETLIASEGSVEKAEASLKLYTVNTGTQPDPPSKKRKLNTPGHQSSLSAYRSPSSKSLTQRLTKRGQTLHLYSPEDIAAHTPCSIIHDFLPAQQANDLLVELLQESETFERHCFKLFDNVVQSPHSSCFYVDSLDEQRVQKTEYLYNGNYLTVSCEGSA